MDHNMLNRARIIADEIIRLRRDIHRHPELSFQEVRTAALVADTLKEIGALEVKTGIGRTGVVGEMGSNGGPVIAIRADMDALPILEKNDVSYRSQADGLMHACGHDAHTAMLLGAAHLLRQSLAAEEWRGRVRFLFQPSEEAFDENGVSGATAMIDDGALEGVDAVLALHISSERPSGELLVNDGFSLAAVDSFDAWIRAGGCHGAYPHEGTDPLFMLAPFLTAFYAIPSRFINPLHPVVVSLGQIRGGEAHNVIPAEVGLKGTIRSYDEETRQRLWHEVERAFSLAHTFGGSYELKINKGYPCMYNDARVNNWLRGVVSDFDRQQALVEGSFGMGGEDFAYMTQQAPGAMFMLGAATADGVKRPHHADNFDIDESVLPLGAAILAETARRFVLGQFDGHQT